MCSRIYLPGVFLRPVNSCSNELQRKLHCCAYQYHHGTGPEPGRKRISLFCYISLVEKVSPTPLPVVFAMRLGFYAIARWALPTANRFFAPAFNPCFSSTWEFSLNRFQASAGKNNHLVCVFTSFYFNLMQSTPPVTLRGG